MYCTKCGSDNSETATYCRKCGALVDDARTVVRNDAATPPFDAEEETRVAVRESGVAARMDGEAATDVAEAEIFSISPTLIFVKAGYAAAAVGALFLVALTSLLLSQYVSVWLSVLIGLMLFLVPAVYHVKQKLVRYTLTDSKLEIDSGLISRITRNVPIRRIQDVTVSATPWQRLLGFGDLVIDNASDEAGKAVLKNINNPKQYADVLLKQMRRLDR